ncbi:PREDICTED: uncharacterized protein LOC108364495 isoform X3 [Rhagoletis zephyria]|uniref:uncharacterized protein LOC108364495 isoform X3 n=1 Tax=Rhagoletis zephyria TaxID=28612 RepID=UPI0008113B83|nr:PREDICTED: uncharacterized protein LOC108364495 isoform X3 [Rhagoletis zephyria]
MSRPTNFLEADSSLIENNLLIVKNEAEEELNQYFAGVQAGGESRKESLAPPRDYKVVQPKPGPRQAANKQKIKDMQTWPDSKYLHLFELVEAQPCLWKRADPNHAKRNVTDASLKKIAKVLECQETEVQARWRSMRQTFFKYLQKEKQTKTVRKREWRFMSSLRFLQCEATEEAGNADNLDGNHYEDNSNSNSEGTTTDVSTEHLPKRTKKGCTCLNAKPVYTREKYFTELISSQVDEFAEKGIEIGNALRRIAKKNSNMADEMYISIRRMILDKEQSLRRSSLPSTSQTTLLPALDLYSND